MTEVPTMVSLGIPCQDLTNVKLFWQHNDGSGRGNFDWLMYIEVGGDGGILPNEPDWDTYFKETLTNVIISGEGSHPAIDSIMKVTRSHSEKHLQKVEHTEYIEAETLEGCDHLLILGVCAPLIVLLDAFLVITSAVSFQG